MSSTAWSIPREAKSVTPSPVAGEDGAGAAVEERHHHLERPLGEAAGIVRSHHQLRELVDQVHAPRHHPPLSSLLNIR